jgi:hypothetical protein
MLVDTCAVERAEMASLNQGQRLIIWRGCPYVRIPVRRSRRRALAVGSQIMSTPLPRIATVDSPASRQAVRARVSTFSAMPLTTTQPAWAKLFAISRANSVTRRHGVDEEMACPVVRWGEDQHDFPAGARGPAGARREPGLALADALLPKSAISGRPVLSGRPTEFRGFPVPDRGLPP